MVPHLTDGGAKLRSVIWHLSGLDDDASTSRLTASLSGRGPEVADGTEVEVLRTCDLPW